MIRVVIRSGSFRKFERILKATFKVGGSTMPMESTVVNYWQRPVCKFLTINDNTIKIFDNFRLHLQTPVLFNDPFEGLNPNLSFLEYDSLITCFTGLYKEDGSYADTLFNPLMWSHYADSHKGICLVFDPLIAGLFPVVYTDDRPIGYDYQKTATHKGKIWSYENEQRFICSKNGSQIGRVEMDAGQYFLKFYPDDLKGIIFGCRTPVEHINRVVNSIYQYAMRSESLVRPLKSLSIQRLAMNPNRFSLEADQCFIFKQMVNPANKSDKQWGIIPQLKHRRDEKGSVEDIMAISPLNVPTERPTTTPGMKY